MIKFIIMKYLFVLLVVVLFVSCDNNRQYRVKCINDGTIHIFTLDSLHRIGDTLDQRLDGKYVIIK